MVTLGELQARTETLRNTTYIEDIIRVYNVNKKNPLQFVLNQKSLCTNRRDFQFSKY